MSFELGGNGTRFYWQGPATDGSSGKPLVSVYGRIKRRTRRVGKEIVTVYKYLIVVKGPGCSFHWNRRPRRPRAKAAYEGLFNLIPPEVENAIEERRKKMHAELSLKREVRPSSAAMEAERQRELQREAHTRAEEMDRQCEADRIARRNEIQAAGRRHRHLTSLW